jgi:hypothetical protein
MVKLFDTPIFVDRKFFFEEICSVEDVADFLENWPEDRRDVAFESIELACSEAMGGGFPANALAEKFRKFINKAGLLARVEDVPNFSLAANDRSVGSR